jgi:hypothetical protein
MKSLGHNISEKAMEQIFFSLCFNNSNNSNKIPNRFILGDLKFFILPLRHIVDIKNAILDKCSNENTALLLQTGSGKTALRLGSIMRIFGGM